MSGKLDLSSKGLEVKGTKMSFFANDATTKQARFIEQLLAERVAPARIAAWVEGLPPVHGVGGTVVELHLDRAEATRLIKVLLASPRR